MGVVRRCLLGPAPMNNSLGKSIALGTGPAVTEPSMTVGRSAGMPTTSNLQGRLDNHPGYPHTEVVKRSTGDHGHDSPRIKPTTGRADIARLPCKPSDYPDAGSKRGDLGRLRLQV